MKTEVCQNANRCPVVEAQTGEAGVQNLHECPTPRPNQLVLWGLLAKSTTTACLVGEEGGTFCSPMGPNASSRVSSRHKVPSVIQTHGQQAEVPLGALAQSLHTLSHPCLALT